MTTALHAEYDEHRRTAHAGRHAAGCDTCRAHAAGLSAAYAGQALDPADLGAFVRALAEHSITGGSGSVMECDR